MEIKFRQFVDNEWHYWGFVKEGVYVGPIRTAHGFGEYPDSYQYTGYNDSRGHPIFSGDILAQIRGRTIGDIVEPLGIVRWDYEYGRWICEDKGHNHKINRLGPHLKFDNIHKLLTDKCDGYIGVIGNIIQSPNLIIEDK